MHISGDIFMPVYPGMILDAERGIYRCITVDADKYTQKSALYKSVECGKNIILFIDDVQQINVAVWAFFYLWHQ